MMKFFKKNWWKFAGVLLLVLIAGSAMAQLTQTGEQSSKINNPIAADNFADLLTLILEIVVQIGTPIVILSIIWVGFLFIKAQGNSGAIQKAREALLWVLVGAAIIIGCNVIVRLVQGTVDVVKDGGSGTTLENFEVE